MSDAGLIKVEVAYARSERQLILPVNVPVGTTALEAVRQSGIGKQFAEIDPDAARLGIFGKAIKPGQVLTEGDRVEIYRPLKADPKEARRARARQG